MLVRRFALAAVLCLFATSTFAAEFRFADIPWGTTADEVMIKLNEAGFPIVIPRGKDVAFAGTMLGCRLAGAAFMSDGKLVKVHLVLTPKDDVKAKEKYAEFQQLLIDKYGEGYEDEVSTLWSQKTKNGENAIGLFMGDDNDLSIAYESPGWDAEYELRKKGTAGAL